MNSNEINVVSENGKETNENTMKNLYFKVHDVIKDAKMQKYLSDLNISSVNFEEEDLVDDAECYLLSDMKEETISFWEKFGFDVEFKKKGE